MSIGQYLLSFSALVIALAATMLTVLQFLRERRSRIETERARYSQREILKALEDLSYAFQKGVEPARLKQPAYLSDSMRRMTRAVERLADTERSSTIVVNNEGIGRSGDRQIGDFDIAIIREIAHSLNTPLLSIEAIALTARAAHGNSPDIEDTLQAVSVCKAVIAAYQELSSVMQGAEGWAPGSLKESVEGAIRVYTRQMKKDVVSTISLPDSVAGYSNNFLTAILLPLLENAIEATSSGGKVVVTSSEDELLRFMVTNSFDGPALSAEIYKAGRTTKQNHHGLGLSTVSRLVENYRNGRVSHEMVDGEVRFTVQLPRRNDS